MEELWKPPSPYSSPLPCMWFSLGSHPALAVALLSDVP